MASLGEDWTGSGNIMSTCFRADGDEFLEEDLELGRQEPRSMVNERQRMGKEDRTWVCLWEGREEGRSCSQREGGSIDEQPQRRRAGRSDMYEVKLCC